MQGSYETKFHKIHEPYIGEWDVMILFCSENALKSDFFEMEWMAVHAIKKPIILVFCKTEHIPLLLRTNIGVEFENVQTTIEDLHKQILKIL